MMTDEALEQIRIYLSRTGKHARYQQLPEFLPEPVRRNFRVRATRLDAQRYAWFSSRVDLRDKTVIEIGANGGYFTLRMARDHRARVIAYEPFEAHAGLIRLFSEITGLEDRITLRQTPVTLASIDALPRADVLVFLNVLQHAGHDFDDPLTPDRWRAFAVSYLNKLTRIAPVMVFQTGYTLGGSAGRICEDRKIIPFTRSLLIESGWNPKRHGLLMRYPLNDREAVYRDMPADTPWPPPLSNTFANRLTNRIRHLVRFSRPVTTLRFAQRPLIICEAK